MFSENRYMYFEQQQTHLRDPPSSDIWSVYCKPSLYTQKCIFCPQSVRVRIYNGRSLKSSLHFTRRARAYTKAKATRLSFRKEAVERRRSLVRSLEPLPYARYRFRGKYVWIDKAEEYDCHRLCAREAWLDTFRLGSILCQQSVVGVSYLTIIRRLTSFLFLNSWSCDELS